MRSSRRPCRFLNGAPDAAVDTIDTAATVHRPPSCLSFTLNSVLYARGNSVERVTELGVLSRQHSARSSFVWMQQKLVEPIGPPFYAVLE